MILIEVKTQFDGYHAYPGAPDEVSYLQHAHRHQFQVEAQISVAHNNRELEFFMVKRELDEFIEKSNMAGCIDIRVGTTGQPPLISCEMMAVRIAKHLHTLYGDDRYINVKVSEDGQNAAIYREDV